ncbi:MAG: NAD-dependent deacylase [Ardenticatenaceae bacterium]|nr:NAD-dependent deacylase [Ardenticatenaceae bacterium]MCB8992061.1 NAD-dependent deacylase [Ardenticatenaceae bacterium]
MAETVTLLRAANHAIALTGAGISTPSGIPDFRSPDSGIWSQTTDPMEVASIYAFKHWPQRFYDWLRPLATMILEAYPNAAHLALAKLEQRGLLKSIITQNIDLLHTKAGSQKVYEVHGHFRQVTCTSCFAQFPAEQYLPEFLETGEVPMCPMCGGILKPDVILYGEMLPISVLNQAQLQTRICDLMLVIGSSLEVAPVGDFPLLAKQSGAKVVMINLEETCLDHIADIIIRADVVDVLPRLAEQLVPW